MFGYIRFVLAYFVLLSHVGVNFLGKNLGVFAVVIFYILAGLVTSKVFLKIAPKDAQISYFVKDRFLRIYPTFFFALVITAIFFYFSSYLEPNFSLKKLLYHALIVPLNYFFWLDLSVINAPIGLNFLIPPSWSLGAELQAYALLVFAIRFQKAGFWLAIVSFLVFAVANLNLINSDVYGYRLVCGVFFMFYSGFLIYQKEFKKLAFFGVGMILLLGWLVFKQKFGLFSIETSLGYLVGIFIILAHENSKVKLKFNNFFGSLSYAIFIIHFLFIWISEYLLGTQNLVFITISSMVFGFINFYLIENYTNKIRFNNFSR